MLKQFTRFGIIILLLSCRHSPAPVVDRVFVDSLTSNYSASTVETSIRRNSEFWKKRMDSLPDYFVNGSEYASSLVARFRLTGNIQDLREADDLYTKVNTANAEKEPGIWRTLASLALLQHQFVRADSCLLKAIAIEGYTYTNAFLDFDASFERGRYARAKELLPALARGNRYGYLFRKSKYEHYDGSLDSSIACMIAAAGKADNNNYIRQAALSNAADLSLHKGNIHQANELYMQSIRINSADMHSVAGLGWIALVHDNNTVLAEKIFQFVHAHSMAPDILLKLQQLEEAKGDEHNANKYAAEFADIVDNRLYGNMYNKYLVDLYTGILKNAAKAVAICEKELINRDTPQVFAWYAWSLYCNNQKEKALSVYKNFVSGKPLEGLELFYMGRMMQELGKKYIAGEFFKAAWKNKYDLDPVKQKYLEKNI